MPCQCTRINRCKNDITKITDAKYALEKLKDFNNPMDSILSGLGASMYEMATPDNIVSCASAIKNMNSGASTSIDAMISQCSMKTTLLQIDLERFEREDMEYHQNLKSNRARS